MTGRLWLETVGSDFDPDRDMVLGPWCFVGAEHIVPSWEMLDFADPFPSAEQYVLDDRQARTLANEFVPIWAEALNRRHSRTYSLRFWRVVLLNWLTVAVPALWSRYRFVEETIARCSERALEVTVAQDCPDWGIGTSGDLLPFLWSAEGDFALSSLIVTTLTPSGWILHTRPSDTPREIPIEPRQQPRPRLGRLPFSHVPGTRLSRLPFSLYLSLLPKGCSRDHYHFDDDSRSAFPAPFLELLDRFLEKTLPWSFRDGFAALEAHALSQRYYPGRLLVDSLNSEDDGLRMVTAMAHERGERLVSSQHGGTYGTHKGMMAAAETEYRYHGFLTWGWSTQEGCTGNFIPVPSPLLSALADRHREISPRLILVGGSMVVHGTRMGWLPKPQHYLSYRRAKLAFLGELRSDVDTAYRPYRRNVTVLEDEDYIRAHFPKLPLVEGDLNAAILGCRLVVLDHPITTMLTALAANVPTILYWERDAWPMAEQAEPLFERLRIAGILFHDPVAAAAQVNAVWDDVPGWWRGPELQAARQAFTQRYARTSRLWWWHWLTALWRLSR